MSEYIITGKQLERLGVPDMFTEQEIVRCRDCKHYKCGDDGWWCLRSISTKSNHPDGFCAWGERRWLTCKCGHEMESEGRCPMCGRYVREDGDAR